MANSGYFPAPGPQNPSKYPFTRENYAKYGEQGENWIYDPYTDTYRANPNVRKQYEIDQGLRQPDPKQPGLSDILLPVAGIGVTYTAANQLGKEIPGLLGGAADKAKDIASLGTGATQAQTGLQGANYATSGVTRGGGGLLGDAAAPGAAAESAPGAFSLGGIGSAGNAILPAVGALGAYDVLSNDYGPARSGIEGAASGAAIGSYFGPPGAVVGGVAGGLIGLGKSFFSQPSTRDIQKKHTSGLLAEAKDNPQWQQYVQGMRAQHNAPPPDPSKPFHGGQYASWDEYKAAGLDPADLTGVYGNLKVYGPQWSSLSFDQQKAVTQANINSGIYDSKKGEVEIIDPAQAKKNLEMVLSGQVQPQQTTNKDPNQSQLQQAAGLLGNAVQKGPEPLARPAL